MPGPYPNDQGNPAGAIPVYIAAASGAGAKSTNITTATSTQVKTGAGTFYGVTVNIGGAGSTATVYDGTSTAGAKLGTFSTAAQGSVTAPGPGLAFAAGLFVVTAGGTPADITVAYA